MGIEANRAGTGAEATESTLSSAVHVGTALLSLLSPVIANDSLDLSGNDATAAIPTFGCSKIAVHLTGNPANHVGTFYIRVGNGTNTATFADVTLTTTPAAAAGIAIAEVIEFDTNCANFIVGYTRASGTGTANVVVNMKV